MASAGFSLGDVAGQVASGGLGGAFLMTLVGLVRNVTRRD
jgi:hypothetical protein